MCVGSQLTLHGRLIKPDTSQAYILDQTYFLETLQVLLNCPPINFKLFCNLTAILRTISQRPEYTLSHSGSLREPGEQYIYLIVEIGLSRRIRSPRASFPLHFVGEQANQLLMGERERAFPINIPILYTSACSVPKREVLLTSHVSCYSKGLIVLLLVPYCQRDNCTWYARTFLLNLHAID